MHGAVVSPDGKPIAGATVRRVRSFDFDSIDPAIPPVVADADGKFALELRQGQSGIAAVFGPGYAPTMKRIHGTTPPQQLTVVMHPGRRLEGRVVDLDGTPIPNAAVEIRARNSSNGIKKTIHSDPDGKFAWEDSIEEEVQLRVSAVGFVERTLSGLAGAPNRVVLSAPTRIRGTVLDDETGTPIQDYSLCARTAHQPGGEMIWQRYLGVNQQAKRSDRGCEFTFRDDLFGRAFGYLVRVQAPGYAPADSALFAAGANLEATYRLKKAEPIRGVVTRADGSLAREGVVYLVLESDPIEIVNGDVGIPPFDGLAHAPIGAEGSFSLPPQIDPYVLVAMCPEGIAVDDRREGKSGELRLQPWARLSGRVTRDGKPTDGVSLMLQREGPSLVPNLPRLKTFGNLTTTKDGRFRADRLTPGRYVVQRRMPTNVRHRDWFADVATIETKPGESYELNIGDRGRLVRGSLAIPKGTKWMIRGSSIAPKNSASPTARYGVDVAEDGRFWADDVPAGEYVLRIALYEQRTNDDSGWGAPVASYTREFKVEGEDSREAVDLGELTPTEPRERPVKVGELAPEFELRAMDGQAVSLGRLKGRFVLLDYWANPRANQEESTYLRDVYERFGGDARFAMVSICLDDRPEHAARIVRPQEPSWPQCRVGPGAPLISAYGAWAAPQSILIDPDGRVIASDLRRDRIAEAVAEALRK